MLAYLSGLREAENDDASMCFRQRRVPQVVPSAGGLARYRGEPVLGVAELPGDHVLYVLAERGVRAQGGLAQHWDPRVIPPGQGVELRVGGVEQARNVAGEI